MRRFAVGVVLGSATLANAAPLELVGKVTVEGGPRRLHQVGDAGYLGASTMSASGELAVIDLGAATAETVQLPRGKLERLAKTTDIEAELVSYTPDRVGIHLTDGTLERAAHHWYAEIDPHTLKVVRSVSLGAFDDRVELAYLGTDPEHAAVWFALTRYAEHLADYSHVHGPEEVSLRRIDQNTLAVTDATTIALPAREMKSGYEDRLMVHHAADFSRFAIVEYDETSFKTQPAAQVYIVDAARGTSFTVPALATTYGVAFTADHIYLASSQLGTLARVDIAAQKIDKTVRGPRLSHDLAIVEDTLYVIGSSKQYTACKLPVLTCSVKKHAAEIGRAAAVLFGNGVTSRDGRFYVLPNAVGDALLIARVAKS